MLMLDPGINARTSAAARQYRLEEERSGPRMERAARSYEPVVALRIRSRMIEPPSKIKSHLAVADEVQLGAGLAVADEVLAILVHLLLHALRHADQDVV